MSEPSHVVDWVSENVALSQPDASLRPYGYQCAIVEAMTDPAVTVRFLTLAEMGRAEHRREAAHLMLWAVLQGHDVVLCERTPGATV